MGIGYLYDISVTDIKTNSLSKVINNIDNGSSINLGITPYGVCIDSTNTTWATSASSDFVTKIVNGIKTNISLAVGSKPYGICVDVDDTVFITNNGTNSISKLVNGIKSDTDIAVGKSPTGICVDMNGVVWVANFMSNTVSKITTSGVIDIKVGSNPFGICIDTDNAVWVTNFGDNTVSKIVNDVKQFDITVGLNPRGICIDIYNSVWVCNNGDNTVSKIVNDVKVDNDISVGEGPFGICTDKDNSILVINTLSSSISKIANNAILDIPIGASPISFGDATGMQAYILFSDLNFNQINKISYNDLDIPLQNMIIVGSETASVNNALYHNTSYPTAELALDRLFYLVSIIIEFNNNVNAVEMGTIVDKVILDWKLNKAITSQSIDQNVGVIPIGIFTKTLTNLNLTTDREWTLSVTNDINLDTLTTSVKFYNKRYWGVSSLTVLSDADILALSNELSDTRVQSRVLDATGGKYIYFAVPSSFKCDISKFKISGISVSNWIVTTRQFVNASGYSTSYDIFRLINVQNGSSILVDIS